MDGVSSYEVDDYSFVILSVVDAARSAASAESKDPCERRDDQKCSKAFSQCAVRRTP